MTNKANKARKRTIGYMIDYMGLASVQDGVATMYEEIGPVYAHERKNVFQKDRKRLYRTLSQRAILQLPSCVPCEHDERPVAMKG